MRDRVSQIQAAYARETNNVLDLARLTARVRRALPHGSWSKLWELASFSLPFSKRKGEMLVTIGECVEELDAQSSAHLPPAWNTLYYLARLGRVRLKLLIGQGRIHPGMSLQEAKGLLAEFRPGKQGTASRSKLQRRLARFVEFVRANVDDWSGQERKTVIEELVAPCREIQAASDETADAHIQDTSASEPPVIRANQPNPARQNL